MHTQNSPKPYTSLSFALFNFNFFLELEIFGFRSVLSEIRKKEKRLTERHPGHMLKSPFRASMYHKVIERVDCLFVENMLYFCLLYVVQVQCFKLALITLLEYPTRVIPATSTQFFSACFLTKSYCLLWNTIKLSTVRMVSSCFLLNGSYFVICLIH